MAGTDSALSTDHVGRNRIYRNQPSFHFAHGRHPAQQPDNGLQWQDHAIHFVCPSIDCSAGHPFEHFAARCCASRTICYPALHCRLRHGSQ